MRKFALLFLIFILGCKTVENIPTEFNNKMEVFFCPRDNCGQHLAQFISNAQVSVHCALYDLDLDNIVSALAAKSQYIDVKLVVDNDNVGELDGAGVKIDDSKQYTHNKFCVVDRKAVWTGSFNPTYNGDNYNNNNAILIYSKYLAKNYEDEFSELWSLDFGSGKQVVYPIIYLNNMKVENYFCPEDSCEARIIKTINNAKQSVYFMTFTFTSEPIADALLFLENVAIKGIFENMQKGGYSQYGRMKGFGLDVRVDTKPKMMHHKVFIIDEKIVITGSFNPTKSANEKNDENILIIYDEGIARKYLEEFNYLWKEKTI
jgi:phosphatidylserine/phosphatidylglycerophosphate/cardiolipin synthase-like enzyme